jgi:hypothetical protein
MNKELSKILNKTLTCKGNPISKEEKNTFESFLDVLHRVSVVYRHVGYLYGKDSFEINPYILDKQNYSNVCEKRIGY